jgi:DnaK suppressor protein
MSRTKLDRQTTHDLEQILKDQLARLEGSLRAVVEENRTAEGASLTDITAHAAETLHAEMQVVLMGQRTQQVAQIQGALERLSAGRYGLCQDCETFIGVPRLRALPFAQRCRDCQGQAEQRARREAARAPREPREREVAA